MKRDTFFVRENIFIVIPFVFEKVKNIRVRYINLNAYMILSIKWDILPDVFEI